MFQQLRRSKSAIAAATTAGVLVAVGAWAAVPNSTNGSVATCYKAGTALRAIDQEAGEACASGEKLVTLAGYKPESDPTSNAATFDAAGAPIYKSARMGTVYSGYDGYGFVQMNGVDLKKCAFNATVADYNAMVIASAQEYYGYVLWATRKADGTWVKAPVSIAVNCPASAATATAASARATATRRAGAPRLPKALVRSLRAQGIKPALHRVG